MNPTVRGFFRKEFLQALRDPRMRMILFVVPIVQMTLFGVAVSTEVRNVRLTYVAEASDASMRRLYDRALATGWFTPASVSHADPYEMLRSGEAEAVLIAPAGGLDDARARGGSNAQLLINATNVVRARAIELYLQRIAQEPGPAPAVRLDLRTLYNPTMETSTFMVPGVMAMLICMVTLILTSMAIARERETGTLDTLIGAPIQPWELMLGKTVPFAVVGLCNIPLILLVGVTLFDVPIRGAFWEVAVSSLVFVICTVSIGVLLSSIARTQQQAMLGAFLFLFPAILLSGLMFPIENMPEWMKILSYLDPLSHFMILLRNILLQGGSADVLLARIGALLAIAAVTATLAYRRFMAMLR